MCHVCKQKASKMEQREKEARQSSTMKQHTFSCLSSKELMKRHQFFTFAFAPLLLFLVSSSISSYALVCEYWQAYSTEDARNSPLPPNPHAPLHTRSTAGVPGARQQ